MSIFSTVVVVAIVVYLWIVNPVRGYRRGKRTDF
jgi:hypothetical protein